MLDDICGELTSTVDKKLSWHDLPLVFVIGLVVGQIAAMLK